MSEQSSSSTLRRKYNHYLNLLRRNEFLVLIVVFTGTLLGGIVSFNLPSIYEARTIFLMEREGVINPLTKDGSIATRLRDKLQIIHEVIHSRTFLLRVIDKLNIDAGLTSNVEVEELVKSMRKQITVKARMRTYDIFEIAYKDTDPQRAQAIDATISDMFIEDNLGVVRRQQNASLNFVKEQLEDYKERLEESERRLREFKEANIAEMPGQESSALAGLGRYQVELEKTFLDLREARLDEATLRKQLSGEEPMVVSLSARNGSLIDRLKVRLANLLTRYTERHPDVIRAMSDIEHLKGRPEAQEQPPVGAESEISSLNPMYQKLREDLLMVARKIEMLEDHKRNYEKKVESYKLKIKAVPAKERRLIQLNRDYRVNDGIYQLLLKRLAEARITRELDLTQRGERFTILEAAIVPRFPVKPDRPKILILSLVLSCMMGAGVLVLKDSLDDSLKSMADAQAFLPVPVVAIIPDMPLAKTVRRRRLWRWIIITMGTASWIVLVALVVLYDQRLFMRVSPWMKMVMQLFR